MPKSLIRAKSGIKISNAGCVSDEKNMNLKFSKEQKADITHAKPHILSVVEKVSKLSWYGLNPHYGWGSYSEVSMQDRPMTKMRQARFHSGLIVSLGGGHRNPVNDLVMWRESVDPHIP